jgi:hypothetical protein
MRPSFLPALVAVAAVVFVSCSRDPLLDRTVRSDTSSAFGSWQGRIRGEFTSAQWTEFESALQEIKLKLMADEEASGTEAVNDALRGKIDGRTVREVFQQGYTAKIWRLNVERAELEKIIAGTASMATRPGDTASERYLADRQRRQNERLDYVVEEIRATEAKLAGLAAPGQ